MVYTGTRHHSYRDKSLKERVTSSSRSSLVSLGQSETHSAGGLRKHEDGGRLHSKARASGLQLPRKSERAQGEESQAHRSGGVKQERRGDSNEEGGGEKKRKGNEMKREKRTMV